MRSDGRHAQWRIGWKMTEAHVNIGAWRDCIAWETLTLDEEKVKRTNLHRLEINFELESRDEQASSLTLLNFCWYYLSHGRCVIEGVRRYGELVVIRGHTPVGNLDGEATSLTREVCLWSVTYSFP